MRFYDVKVRLGGSRVNEVRKELIPAPEVLVLRAVHGDDAVDVTAVRGASDARYRLYDGGEVRELSLRDWLADRYGPHRVKELFGARGPLPEQLDADDLPADDPPPDLVTVPPRRRGPAGDAAPTAA